MSKPNIMQVGPWAWARIQKLLANPKAGTAEYFRAMLGMEIRPVKPQGKTHRQLEKQRARNRARRPRAWFKP